MKPARLALVLGLGVAASLQVVFLLGFCVGSPRYYSANYSPAPGLSPPSRLPLAILPEVQTEPHTCGLHSLRSVYRAYAVDPDAARLRFRLSVDQPATNFDPESLGTIHPDIVRVARQDGFDATLLPTRGDEALPTIRAHVESGHPVLALVRVNSLHWLVLAGIEGDNVIIADSLAEQPYREPLDTYVRDRVLSAILLRPRE
ncbi:MAG TPA: hypothetical protein PLU35_06195 [Phycisphaerales bacterium]|nr:hypothetical protein [Phycisphaerales bacterium]